MCPVCQGRRKVTLRLYEPMRVISHEARVPDTAGVTSKDYPCPECAPTTGEEKVALLECGISVTVDPEYARDPEYRRAMERDAAHQMVDFLTEKRLIKFTTHHDAGNTWGRGVRVDATLGVVSPNVVASMQERITANGVDVARQMAEAAASEVRIWGSHYTGDEGGISKGQAVDAIYRALKRVQEGLS